MEREYAFNLAEFPAYKPKASPFLRWAGGKSALLPKVIALLPKRVKHYYEPFFGGGALFFAISPKGNKSTISDTNEELINCYQQVALHPEEIISPLSKLTYNKKFYRNMRDKTPKNDLERAIRFIYLNRTCWNGLYRVNKNGKFNVPFGKFAKEPVICPSARIIAASNILKEVKIIATDFEKAVEYPNRDDFVYFDPPFTVKHDNNGFRQYNERVFSWKDQERLSELSIDLKKRGVKIMISNATDKDVMGLYGTFYKYKVSRVSTISGITSKRGRVDEAIITSYKIPKENIMNSNVEVC